MPGNAFNNELTTWTPDLDDRLCELVEQDCYSFAQIAGIMGLSSRACATSRWRRIVARMGWQAV